MAHWVIRGLLAISTRPGYRPGDERFVELHEVEEWVEKTKAKGIASILCLLDEDQLPLYRKALPQGLLAYYREAGFHVAHLPTHDGLSEPYTPEEYERAWEYFRALPKPVLVHCSAGHDRTGRVVRYILAKLEEAREESGEAESAAR